MIFFKEKRILKENEKMNSYFNDRLNEQEERINRISVEANSNYSRGYINDRKMIEFEEKIYRLNEDLKFIVNTDIVIIILLTIFIGINIYLLIH